MKRLRISQIFSKLEVTKPIIDYIAHMHNFIVKFGKILDIFKEFAGNRVNEFGNVPRMYPAEVLSPSSRIWKSSHFPPRRKYSVSTAKTICSIV